MREEKILEVKNYQEQLKAQGKVTKKEKLSEIEELYRIELSPSTISYITDKVFGTATEWQNRMLNNVY
ncbi:TPA: transposase [Clostridium perfringens]|nr:transposase [Clostridium perfringens]HBI7048499.1 transposase [Clostridium perfringens]HBI7053625.1 transposase [Clostridium perfringens]HBI7344520.1 transposase [Clostridium perfringens]